MIEPRHRTIVDGKGEAALRLVAKRKANRRLDRSAMCYRNHVPARVLGVDPLDCTTNTIVEIHKTLAARRRVSDRRKPVAANFDRPAGEERRAVQSLPFAEMLFGQRRLVLQLCGFRKSRGPDRVGGLMRPLQ